MTDKIDIWHERRRLFDAMERQQRADVGSDWLADQNTIDDALKRLERAGCNRQSMYDNAVASLAAAARMDEPEIFTPEI